jgi:hypothetical protein
MLAKNWLNKINSTDTIIKYYLKLVVRVRHALPVLGFYNMGVGEM